MTRSRRWWHFVLGAILGVMIWVVGGLIPPDVPAGSNPHPTARLAPWLMAHPCAYDNCTSHGPVVTGHS